MHNVSLHYMVSLDYIKFLTRKKPTMSCAAKFLKCEQNSKIFKNTKLKYLDNKEIAKVCRERCFVK